MRLSASAVLLLLLALTRTWTGAEPSPDNQVPDHQSSDHLDDTNTGLGSTNCSKFNSPLSLKDKTPVLGRLHFLAGFTDNTLYRTLLGLTSSFWFNITDINTGLAFRQFNKMNGTCIEYRANATISEDKATVLKDNITSEFLFISSSSHSLILETRTSTSNISDFIQKLRLDPADFSTGLKAVGFYLMSREPQMSETDLQLFREHAKCAGFSGELDYLHNKEHEYCTEEESVLTIY